MGLTLPGAYKLAANLEKGPYSSIEDLVDIMTDKISTIQKPGDISAWMDLCRFSRQPQILWHVDYLEPRKILGKVNDLIRKSENTLYDNKTSTVLKDGYMADLQQQSAFNTIRAHLRAEEGDFDASLKIFRSLLNDFHDQLTTIRQSNLLMHCCLAFVCCGKFRESYTCFQKHWILLKSLHENERLSLGVWDNHVILHMIYWFLASYIRDFRDFYEVETEMETSIMAHKKIALLKSLQYDHTWIASFMGLAFHKHLCKLYPTVPPWTKKITTSENFVELWEKNPGRFLREEKSAPSIEKQYYERYNKQFLPHTKPNEDEVENCLYSYYHFQESRVTETTLQDQLNIFLSEHLSSYKTILSVGPGFDAPHSFHNRVITVVDISEYVCKALELRFSQQKTGNRVIHSCMSKFVRETDEHFDVCMARDVLQNLSRARLDVFLYYMPLKCHHLAASIDLRNDVRTDILSGSSPDTEVYLHKSVLTEEEWLTLLQEKFYIKHKRKEHYLYVYGKSKF